MGSRIHEGQLQLPLRSVRRELPLIRRFAPPSPRGAGRREVSHPAEVLHPVFASGENRAVALLVHNAAS